LNASVADLPPASDAPLLISVVTVVYNGISSLEPTILSVLSQSWKNCEYIIIDGGSTDGTAALVKKYESQLKYWISESDKGIYDAMNKALKVATGDFLIFINAGDTFFSPHTLKEFVQLSPDRENVYYGNARYTDALHQTEYFRGGNFSKYRLSKTNICHQTIFYSRKAYQNNSYSLKYPVFADWAYNIRLFKSCGYTWINQTIANYDLRGFSAETRDVRFERDQKLLFLRYLGFDSLLYILLKKISD